jgi:hypothetical protein
MVDEPGTTGFVFLDAVFNRHIELSDRLLATGSRGYTIKTHLRGLKTLDFH